MGKLVRTVPVAALVATALMAAPSGAGAATTLGETFTPPTSFLNDVTWLQSTSPGGKYAAPSDGVITSWSFQAGPTPPTGLKFKAARAAGGNDFTIVGESGVVAPEVSKLNTYLVKIPVQANDIIGFWSAGGQHGRSNALDYALHRTGGDKPPSSTPVTYLPEPSLQLDLSAKLEADCDKDGLGDETQDPNISTCAPGTTPPPAPGPGGTTVTCKGLAATIVGTNGSDVRTGSLGQDVIAGLGGNDTLSGIAGNDVICGGAGKDTLKGGKGKDSLLGQKGKDALKGGGGKDLCKGGKGNDTASKCEVEKSI
jgi:Ca2+-binding RTX toxin-like protein